MMCGGGSVHWGDIISALGVYHDFLWGGIISAFGGVPQQ